MAGAYQYRRSAVRCSVRLRRVLVVSATLAVLGGAGIATATPAGAHTVGGIDATNYRTRILAVTPATPGVTVRVIDHGDRLELRNTARRDVVVEGYEGEPYLRVGPRGVFENVRSPATFLNRVRRDPAPAPPSADATAPPEWRRVSSGTTARWHDHRAHWMGTRNPPVVDRAPDREHLIQRFRIVVRRDAELIVVRGDVRWIPGPSPWPWLLTAVGLGTAVAVGARTRAGAKVVGGALAVALAAAFVHAVGAWPVASDSLVDRAANALPTAGALALGIAALALLARRGLHAAAPLLVFAGLFVGIAVGLADLPALSRSQLPTDLPPAVDRLTVALALAGGFGAAAGAARHVAARGPRPVPAPAVTASAGLNENESHSMMGG